MALPSCPSRLMHGTRDRLQQTWLRRFFGCRRLKSRPAWRVFARAMSPLILPIWAILGAAGLRGGPNGDGFGQCWTAFGSSLHLAYMWYLPEPVLTTGVFFIWRIPVFCRAGTGLQCQRLRRQGCPISCRRPPRSFAVPVPRRRISCPGRPFRGTAGLLPLGRGGIRLRPCTRRSSAT